MERLSLTSQKTKKEPIKLEDAIAKQLLEEESNYSNKYGDCSPEHERKVINILDRHDISTENRLRMVEWMLTV